MTIHRPLPAGQVGRSVPRLEARRKVTGRAEYVHNLVVPGMLHTKVVRSTVPHGRILSIDTAAAEALEGVYRVVTADDIRTVVPDPWYGPAFHDQPVLAIDKVRHVGEPVVAVLAEDPYVAAEAAQLVVVEYEPMEPVFDEIEAMTSTAVVHEVLKPAGTFPDLKHLVGRRDTNVALDYRLRRGDVDAAFAAADRVFEHEFKTQQVMHTPLEPMVSLAEPGDDALTIHTASQSPSFVRIEIARLLGWPENRVRVKVPYLGGGFGAKLYIKLEALVACLALLTRRPVKWSLTMEEQFYTITKHASTFRIASAVKDGHVTGRRCEVFWNGGAYADIGPRVTQKSGFTAPGPYDIDNVAIDSYALYTNRPPAGALRGFGIPQLVWAYESHTDLIARGLGVDPVAFRRRNILREGRPQATGTVLRDAAIEGVLDDIARRMDWDKPFDRGSGTTQRGRGIAVGFKASIAPTTSVAIVNVAADGSANLYLSTVDMGQGSDTAMAQIVAETLALRTEDVKVVHPDTDVTPYDMATLGSRSTFHAGNAVKLAAEHARDQIEALAKSLGLPPGSNYGPADLFKKKYGMQAGNIIGVGTYIPDYKSPAPETGLSDNVTPFWMVGGTGVEIEVDTETGHVRILRMVNACDVGRPLNPKIVETQISGAALMQLGFTMFENMDLDGGQVTNASLADYKIPGMHDVPDEIESLITEAEQHSGPYGAKGVGESATFGVSPAIANAIHDAVGIRLTALPLSPEAVFRALREAEGNTGTDAK
ncbi:xanthine dehydrogenase family protein molybdopterin-binding subunit [Rhodoplanes sp. TEM]|uniref:Xanthine dehydrogenase family protein molybdopterin-binding subunit n=1 Tax=Rhodoplanes tepidamans TaxID=200616 RepID=A0ABT5J6A5_RHOTP|nr:MULTISPECIES: xanthine dehydrogenase family protein molybdopterin-binding subunit [Rhodoplanes]MDC7785184.1 xanthine dehydrogenase family protein molybdopterin-binding subunit [Rhodoplanes tepidamans]MDC7987134.1 xanthine dehydrogenase family protein molybdopterin-binding subunit [Rhodoplanes sp. TEM]MDQ0353441.1 CO/xanthine dehydrogenase Mo-binding subunit [Rhodoplanes tepidamans]